MLWIFTGGKSADYWLIDLVAILYAVFRQDLTCILSGFASIRSTLLCQTKFSSRTMNSRGLRYILFTVCWHFVTFRRVEWWLSKAQYTPPTPTRRNCRVSSRQRCVHEFATTADEFGDANAQRSRRPWPSLQFCSQWHRSTIRRNIWRCVFLNIRISRVV